MAVGATGHSKDWLIYQQQRRGEISTARKREHRAAENHPRGKKKMTVLNFAMVLCISPVESSVTED